MISYLSHAAACCTCAQMVTGMDLSTQNYYCLQLYCYYHNCCCSAVAAGVFLLFSMIPFFVALRPNAGHGIFSLEVSTLHITTHHSRYDSYGRAINSSHRPLTTHHITTNIHAPARFETTISTGEQPQNYALDKQICRIQLQNSAPLSCL